MVVLVAIVLSIALAAFRVIWERRAYEREREQRQKAPSVPDSALSLHQACYLGRLGRVRDLLEEGDEVNEPAREGDWIYFGKAPPRPLNCVAIAHVMTDAHVEIAKLLIGRGAVVDVSVRGDHLAESVGSPNDEAFPRLLEGAAPPAPRGP